MNNQNNQSLTASQVFSSAVVRDSINDIVTSPQDKPAKKYAGLQDIYLDIKQEKNRLDSMEEYQGMEKKRTANGKLKSSITNPDGTATKLQYHLIDKTKLYALEIGLKEPKTKYSVDPETKEEILPLVYLLDTQRMNHLKEIGQSGNQNKREGIYQGYNDEGIPVNIDLSKVKTYEEISGDKVYQIMQKAGLLRGKFLDELNAETK